MIASLRGILTQQLDHGVVIDVGGVGFELTVPLSTRASLPPVGETVSMVVLTQVREDAITLFGFGSTEERDLFLALTSVSQIGPKLAVAILGNAPPVELVEAIALGDIRRLAMVPGVGKKTAARMVLELKDKLPALAGVAPSSHSTALTGTTRSVQDDVIEALEGLGFRRTEIAAVLGNLRPEPDEPLEDLLRRALSDLTPRGR